LESTKKVIYNSKKSKTNRGGGGTEKKAKGPKSHQVRGTKGNR